MHTHNTGLCMHCRYTRILPCVLNRLTASFYIRSVVHVALSLIGHIDDILYTYMYYSLFAFLSDIDGIHVLYTHMY